MTPNGTTGSPGRNESSPTNRTESRPDTRTDGERPVVVITGASAGVGRATVRRFARDGARIALLARGEDRLAAAADEVERAGGEALVIPTDVADAEAVEAAAARTEAELGPIDIGSTTP